MHVKIKLKAGSLTCFDNFVSTLHSKLGIISHSDVDGFVSALLAYKFFSKRCKVYWPIFLDYLGFDLAIRKLIRASHLAILDIGFDKPELYNSHHNFLIVDHHPFKHDLNSSNVCFIKTRTETPASLTCYGLFARHDSSIKQYDWLVALAIIADYTFKHNKEFVKFIASKYGYKISKDIFNSQLGSFVRLLNLAIIYFHNNYARMFKMLLKLNSLNALYKVETYSKIVQAEIDRLKSEFYERRECFNDTYIFVFKSRFPVTGTIATLLSSEEPNKTYIFVGDIHGEQYASVSARRQDGNIDLPLLLKEATSSINCISCGGHRKAAAARISRNDIGKFVENIKKLVKQ